jgi:hypothetical protein
MKHFFWHFCPEGKWTSFSNRVPVKNNLIIAFFTPIVYATLGITSSCPWPNILGDSQL